MYSLGQKCSDVAIFNENVAVLYDECPVLWFVDFLNSGLLIGIDFPLGVDSPSVLISSNPETA